MSICHNFNYNILNIAVNTEQPTGTMPSGLYYNILNIAVNTELEKLKEFLKGNYNILNIAVNTEQNHPTCAGILHYNILNIAVNTEHINNTPLYCQIITY